MLNQETIVAMTGESSPTSQSTERRRYRRLPSANLNAVVKVRRGLISQQYSTKAIDYSKFGLAMLLPKPVNIEQNVLLKLKLVMDMGDIVIDKVDARVTSCELTSNEYRVGVVFDYNGSKEMKSLETQSRLSRIEGILEKSLSLKSRIESQAES